MKKSESFEIYPLHLRTIGDTGSYGHKQQVIWAKEGIAEKQTLTDREKMALAEEALSAAERENTRLKAILYAVDNISKFIQDQEMPPDIQYAGIVKIAKIIDPLFSETAQGLVVIDMGSKEGAVHFREYFASSVEAELLAMREHDIESDYIWPEGYIYPYRDEKNPYQPTNFVFIKAVDFPPNLDKNAPEPN